MIRRLFLRILGAVLALGLTAEVYIQTHRGDVAAPDDADLASQRAPVPDDRNGFVRLQEAAEGLVWSEETAKHLSELRRAGRWDTAAARSLIDPNGAAFAVLRAALGAPEFQDPELHHFPEDPPLEEFLKLQRFATLSAVRAIERAHAGDADGALEDALAAVRLGLRLQEDRGGALIRGTHGCAVQGIGLDAIRLSLPHLSLRAADSLRWSRELAELEPPAAAWRSIWAAEYRNSKEMFASAERMQAEGRYSRAAGPVMRVLLPEDYSFKTNATLALFAEAYRELQTSSDQACLPAIPADPRSAGWAGAARLALSMVGPNGGGRILVQIAMPNFRGLARHRCRLVARFAATQALLGLRAHQVERGRLPDSLSELVPDYLAELPQDPFDGAPLRYAPARKVLYSVGSNLADEHGVEPADDSQLLEPSFPVPF